MFRLAFLLALALAASAGAPAGGPDGRRAGRRPWHAAPFGEPRRRDDAADRRAALAALLRPRRAGRLAAADRRIERRPADADRAAGRLRRPCLARPRQRRQAPDPRRGSAQRTADPQRRRLAHLGDAQRPGPERRLADRPVQAVDRHLRARSQQSRGQARLFQGARRRHHRPAGRRLPHRLDLPRHGRDRIGRRRQGGGRRQRADADQFDRRRRHQGRRRQADRRDPAPPLRDGDDQARQRARRRSARQQQFHRADAGRRPHPRPDRRLPVAGARRRRIRRHRPPRIEDLPGDLRGAIGYGPRRGSCCTRGRETRGAKPESAPPESAKPEGASQD